MKAPKQTRKYKAAQSALNALGAGAKGLMVRNGSADNSYAALDAAGYWWDSQGGQWKQRVEGQSGTDGRYRLAAGVYRLRVTCHESDVIEVCKKIAAEHRIVDMSEPYKNDRDGTPEIVRVYFTCLK